MRRYITLILLLLFTLPCLSGEKWGRDGSWGRTDSRWGRGVEPNLTAFRSQWKTDNAGTSNDDQITLPLIDDGSVAFMVSWGDGSRSWITAYDDAAVTHTYPATGTYNVKITGTIRGWKFDNGGDKLKILDISEWGVLDISVNDAFFGCENLECTATDAPIVSTTDLSYTFHECFLLTNIGNAAGWDVSSVTDMYRFLRRASIFDQDLSSLDIGLVTDMEDMLIDADALSTANYSNMLIAWEAGAHQDNVIAHFGDATYTLAAAAAHARLTVDDGWTITDGGCELGIIVDWWRIEEGVTKDGSDKVSSWLGSINGIDLAQGTGAKQPTWTADQINGYPAIVFDGTADFLKGAFGASYAQPNTVILISDEPADVDGTEIFIDGFDDAHRMQMWQSGVANNDYRLIAPLQYVSTYATGGSGFKIWSFVFNGASSKFRVNGTDYSSADDVGNHEMNGITIGADRDGAAPAPLKTTDVVVVNGGMNATQLGIAETYLDDLRGGVMP